MTEAAEAITQEKRHPGRPPKNDGIQDVKRPKRRIKFMNNEDPEMDVTFTFVTKDWGSETYRLWPGYEYELPEDVIRHLNSLAYPVYQAVQDPVTGQIVHKQVGTHNRFSCHPVE